MINVDGNISARALPTEGAAMYKKTVDIFSAIIDTGFGIGEQQTQEKDD